MQVSRDGLNTDRQLLREGLTDRKENKPSMMGKGREADHQDRHESYLRGELVGEMTDDGRSSRLRNRSSSRSSLEECKVNQK